MNRLRKMGSCLLVVLLLIQMLGITASARIPMRKPEAIEQPAASIPQTSVPETEPATTENTEPEETDNRPEQGRSLVLPDSVPQYFMNGYTDQRYADGTVATHGSSITALAMVATYLTGHAYAPNELADYFGGYIGNYYEKLEYAADQLQLPWKPAGDCHNAIRALEEGKIVIVLVEAGGIFNSPQHYVVWTGMTEDGKVLVNDPNKENYSHWRLIDGLEEGFAPSEVCAGFGAGWIFDKSVMPEEPFLYVEEGPVEECRYPDISLSEKDIDLFAKILWLEARGESREGQQAVAEVILNRMVTEGFPDSLYWVIHAEGQFPSAKKLHEAEPTQTQYDAIEDAMYGPYILPIDVVFYATYQVNDLVWGDIGGHWFCYRWDWTAEE